VSIVKQLVSRADSWVNAMTGLGTLRDKLTHAQVVPGATLGDPTLEALFNDDDVARRIVTKLPREATRRGFRIVLEGDDDGDDDEEESADVAAEMLDRFQKLDAMPKLRDGWIWARLYGGGSGVFVGADDGRSVDQPLNEAGIRTINFLNVLKRPQVSIERRYLDVTAPRFGEPEIYKVHRATATGLLPREGLDVHESRLILFDGAMTARSTTDSATGFDDSVLQAAMASLQQNATAWQSIAHLLTDASQGVLKIANLVDLVAADGQETLRARVQLMDMARSVCRSILVDAEKESFERIATSFAGLPEVMDRLMMRMSSAADGMPVTLLFGRSPAGLNATGESDIRSWYDTVAEGQTDEFKPRLERLLRLMFMAKDSPTRGRVPKNWCIEFNPLWQPTDKELADTKKVKADTYVALVGAQIMTDAEAGLGLAPDFPTIDVESREELAEADKDEGLRPREVNVPPPEPANDNGDPDDDGGGGGGEGNGPKGRSDSGREDAQARVPAGSPRGGQWTSGGGAHGGKAAALANIRTSVVSGKNAAVVAMQQKLVQRYGVPLAKASLMYERDIKAQMKAAKAQRATARAPKKAVVAPPKPPASHADVDAHEQGLKQKYGDAARTVAWGRAMHDRGMALSVEEFEQGIQNLTRHGLQDFSIQTSSRLREVFQAAQPRSVGEFAAALKKDGDSNLAARVAGTAAIVAHRRALEADGAMRTEEIKLKPPSVSAGSRLDADGATAAINGAKARYHVLSHRDLQQPTDYDFVADNTDRGGHWAKAKGQGKDEINIGAGHSSLVSVAEKTTMHEWGHALEAANPKLSERAIVFYEGRTSGQKLRLLGAGYEAWEYTRDGDPPWANEYVGKEYARPSKHSGGKDERYSTEITSMGAQDLTSHNNWGDLYEHDAETAHFTLGQLANQ
jgi:uncharacterized protein